MENSSKRSFLFGGIISLFVFLALFRILMLSTEQACLRSVVVDLSTCLYEFQMDYWWDFGTLLGLMREGNIIYSEVDADISIPVETRRNFFEVEGFQNCLSASGFQIEKRDELKLRLYGPWGWFGDMDVWEPAANHTLFMVTGRNVERNRYILPQHLLLPTQPWENIPNQQNVIRTLPEWIRVPAQPSVVLEYWYGPTWVTPRKYDKGNDPSTDALELFFFQNAVWIYEVGMAFKFFFRILVNGVLSLLRGVFNFPNVFGLLSAVALSAAIFREPTRRSALYALAAACLSLVLGTFVMTLLLVLFS